VNAVSIVLPTKNGGARLRSTLDAVRRQHFAGRVEIVGVDSGSTDGTLELLQRRADTLVRIGANAFNHGTSRNLGIERACGDLVVLLVQDAVPVGDGWLQALVAPLQRDARIAGSFARQVADPAASPLTRHYLDRWFAAGIEPRTMFTSRDEFDLASPAERFDRCIFDNVCSCIRRDVWQKIPFRRAPIAEDMAWARDVLLAGYGLAYAPAAVVEHSHDRSAGYELKRTWVLHQQLYHLFGLRTIPGGRDLLRAIAGSLRLHRHVIANGSEGPGAQLRGAALAIAWPLGQYGGGWTAAHGRDWRPGDV
jgi:GT2 family glycosyltransferase